MDILSDESLSLLEQYDCIVSNPPYIMEQEKVTMEQNVLDYEPQLALFVPDDDPLLFYRRIARIGKNILKKEEVFILKLMSVTELKWLICWDKRIIRK